MPTASTRSLALASCLASCARPVAPPTSAPAASNSARVVTATPLPATRSPRALGPPPPGVPADSPWPPFFHGRLSNGLELMLLPRRGVPLVALELALRTGRAQDETRPGRGLVCSELLRRSMAHHPGPLARTLELSVELEQTRFSMVVPTTELALALDELGGAASPPPVADFILVRRQMAEQAKARAERDRDFAVDSYLHTRLYALPAGQHPYASPEPNEQELMALGPLDCARHRGELSPERAILAVVGDFDRPELERLAARAFGRWHRTATRSARHATALPPARLEVGLLDRPRAARSTMVLGTLGPDSTTADAASIEVALELVRGRGIDASFSVHLDGSSLVVLRTEAATSDTPEAVRSLLERLEELGSRERTDEQLQAAIRALADGFWVGNDTNQKLARRLTWLGLAGLGDDAWDHYRARLRDVTARRVKEATQQYLAEDRMLLVVSGDAARLERALSRFGPVSVITPTAGFVVRKRLGRDATAPLTIPPN